MRRTPLQRYETPVLLGWEEAVRTAGTGNRLPSAPRKEVDGPEFLRRHAPILRRVRAVLGNPKSGLESLEEARRRAVARRLERLGEGRSGERNALGLGMLVMGSG